MATASAISRVACRRGRYEFIIIGPCCAVWGIVAFLFLPDSPVKNRYFTEREKRIITLRLQENQTGFETKVFKWKQAKEALMDPKTYAFLLITVFVNIPNGGLSNFGTHIIKGFGFSTLVTTLMQVPNWGPLLQSRFYRPFSLTICSRIVGWL